MMHLKSVILFYLTYCGSSFAFVPFENRDDDLNVCCVQNDWEAHFFLDSGIVLNGQYTVISYFNGTVHTAYSYDDQKLYYGITVTEQSPLIPHPLSHNKTLLADYAMDISYTVTGEQCEKDQLSDKLNKLCIPHDAKLLSTGEFGEEARVLDTYQFNQSSDVQWQITATVFRNRLSPVEPKVCEPFHATYCTLSFNPDSGLMYSYDIMDFGPIKSHDIFDVPEACRHLV